MENGNFHALAQFFLNVEAFWCLDVLEIDTTERRLQGGDDVDQFVRVRFGKLDVKHIDTCEFFK
jgi:hypothetical protein